MIRTVDFARRNARDLDIEGDPVALVRGSPDRSQLLAMFEKYEFKNLIARIPLLDGAGSA